MICEIANAKLNLGLDVIGRRADGYHELISVMQSISLCDKLYAENKLFISQKTERGTYYIAAYEFDMIVEVDQYYLSFLEWDYMKWYNEAFIFHNIAYVRDIKFEFNGEAFNLSSDQTYDFELNNTYSYAYYVNEKNEFKAVNLTDGKIVIDGNKKVYKLNGKSYDIVAEVNLDEVEVVGNKEILQDPTRTDVVYVEEKMYGDQKKECGNYKNLSLQAAKAECKRYLEALNNRKADFKYE